MSYYILEKEKLVETSSVLLHLLYFYCIIMPITYAKDWIEPIKDLLKEDYVIKENLYSYCWEFSQCGFYFIKESNFFYSFYVQEIGSLVFGYTKPYIIKDNIFNPKNLPLFYNISLIKNLITHQEIEKIFCSSYHEILELRMSVPPFLKHHVNNR